MPKISNLEFYSYSDRQWHNVLYDQINNYCYARRTIIDAFLWFGHPLKAEWLGRTASEYKMEGKYLLPGFIKKNFKTHAWIETARIDVIGKLQAGNSNWNNHEAVVVNTENGIRIIDLSFSKVLIPLEEWFENFAPQEIGKTCQQVS